MEYTHLGRLGLVVSRLSLGTMNFGPHASEGDSHAIMDAAIAHGVNFFDTANVYGRHLGVGATEEIIGRWFAKGGGRREKVVLATQGLRADGRLAERGPTLGARDPQGVRGVAQAAAAPTTSTCIRCTTSTATRGGTRSGRRWSCSCSRARSSTSARSNFAGWHIARANEIARGAELPGAGVRAEPVQPDARTVELEVLPAVREYGMGFIPYSPLAGGLLAGALSKVDGGAPLQRVPAGRDRASTRDQLERWEKLCGELGERPADVALAWLLAQPGVTSPIIGPRTPDQLARVDARARDPPGRRRARSGWTRSSRVRAVPRPRPTPGSRAPVRYRAPRP